MDLNNKVTQLEDEIKILKNEVQAVLLDLRESFLNNVNPFNPNVYSIPPRSKTGESQSSDDISPPSSSEKQDLVQEDSLDVPENDEEAIGIINSYDGNLIDNLENDDVSDQPTVSFMPASNGELEATPKEKIMGWGSGNLTVAQYKSYDTVAAGKNQLDLSIIVSLSEWVEDSVDRLGHERTRIILDVTETMRYITPELKNILVKFIHPRSDDDEIVNSKQDYLSSLIKLNNLLGTENRMEVALLYILCQEHENR